MNILINARCKVGGGISVSDSICSFLYKFRNHKFTVVLCSSTAHISDKIKNYDNVVVVNYDMPLNFNTVILHRDKFLDRLVKDREIDCVLTVFGPSFWSPRVPHLCGFARPHIVWPNSPYFQKLSVLNFIREKIFYKLLLWCFKKSSQYFYTENPCVSEKLQKLIPKSCVFTVTSYYHQIYDQNDKWLERKLPPFDGVTLLTISAPYLHKNLPITIEVAKILKENFPDFKFRFIMTLKPEELQGYDETLKENFVFLDRVKIEECPSLYKQSNLMWMPTLLECFSGTYAEAMKMETPTITTDLEFAHGCCGKGAKYFSPLSAKDAAECIYKLSHDEIDYKEIILAGRDQLKSLNTSEERASMLIGILEQIVKHNKI